MPAEVEYPYAAGETNAAGRLESWRRRSALGAMMSGLALGLRDVLEPEREEPSITLETSGAPPRDLPVEADIEDVPAKHNVVKVRPWLLGSHDRSRIGQDRPAPADAGEDRPAGANRTATPARSPSGRLRRLRLTRKRR